MKFYAIKVGREAPAITTTWDECTALVTGFSGALFKSFNNINDAFIYLNLDQSLFDVSALLPALSQKALKEQPSVAASSGNSVQTFFMPKKPPMDLSNLHKVQNQEHKELIKQTLLPLMQKDEILVYTDGSCLNQGLADKSLRAAGAGVYLPQLDLKIGLQIDGEQTNNRGELYPIIWILEVLYETLQNNKGEVDKRPKIVIHSDSTYAMNIDGKNLKNLDMWTMLRAILIKFKEAKIEVAFVKALAHSGIYGNEMADRIADHMATLKLTS